MKRKILLIMPSFGIGGTTVSVKNLTLTLDSQMYNIYVMPMKKTGSLKALFDDVKQIETPFIVSSLTYSSWRDEPTLIKRPICALLRFLAKTMPTFKTKAYKKAAKAIMDKYQFNTVVACQENKATHFVQYFNCSTKVAWIRCDYYRIANTKKYKRQEKDIYEKYNSIVCVSDVMTEHFVDIFPEYRFKTYTINNPQCSEFIKRQALNDDHDARFAKEGFTILSLGRFNPVKRFSHIPRIAKELTDKGLNFKWFIIGGSDIDNENSLITLEIKKYDIEDRVICLGIKSNPHFYIANSDLLVNLSISEACPRVINEAKILHVPVVCTDFDSACEFIMDGHNGMIRNIDSIGTAIYEVLSNQELYDEIRSNICCFEFDNTKLTERLNQLL